MVPFSGTMFESNILGKKEVRVSKRSKCDNSLNFADGQMCTDGDDDNMCMVRCLQLAEGTVLR